MKNSSIKKINTAGKVGYIMSVLLIVAAIAVMVAIAIGITGMALISKEDVSVRVSTNIDVDSKGDILDTLDRFVKIDGSKNLRDFITEEGKSVSMNDADLSELSIIPKDKGLAINAKTNEIKFSAGKIIASLVATFIYVGAITVMLYMVKGLMNELKSCETPFTENVIKYMTRFGTSLIPVVVLKMLCGGFWSSIRTGSDFSMTVNVGMVLIVAVVYILTVVFKYGAQLQQESDETL